jgi:hypothetical protein
MARLLRLATFLCLVIILTSCDEGSTAKNDQELSASRENRIVAKSTRYELHEIKNGSYAGTALLDKNTGRVWILGSTSKAGHVTGIDFSEIMIFPQPAAALPDEPSRYELHPIQNGGFAGTALLDRRTGRIWTLSSDSRGNHVSNLAFTEASVYPAPASSAASGSQSGSPGLNSDGSK